LSRIVSVTVTRGIRIQVKSRYLRSQSDPQSGRFAFAYTVEIRNDGKHSAQLLTRHWVITDADDGVREVRGDGVVGEQPKLEPGQSFEYTSGCILGTPWGTMHGSYQFRREDGESFDAEISPFLLASTAIETTQSLN
jgi:ApaG protein